MSIVERLNRVPPNLCRLLARTRHGYRLMTAEEISQKSGIAYARVVEISHMTTWENLPLRVIERFSQACGVNLLAPKEQFKFLRRCKRVYLNNATPQQRQMIARLLANLHMTQ